MKKCIQYILCVLYIKTESVLETHSMFRPKFLEFLNARKPESSFRVSDQNKCPLKLHSMLEMVCGGDTFYGRLNI